MIQHRRPRSTASALVAFVMMSILITVVRTERVLEALLCKLFLIDRRVTSAGDHCQSKPEGPGSPLEGPPEDFFGFILNDSFSWWALTASAAVLRPNSDAISVLGIFWAMRFSLAMSTSVHGRISRWGIVVSSNARVTRSNSFAYFSRY
jgi:hypothetical protein